MKFRGRQVRLRPVRRSCWKRSWPLAAVLLVGVASRAEPRAGAADQVAARVGGATLSVGAVEQRWRALSPAERSALGGAPSEGPKRLVEGVLAPELASEQAARARGLEKTPRARDRTREILRLSLEQALRAEALAKKPVTSEEIQAYFDAHRAQFERPAKIWIWRILVADQPAAEKLLKEAQSAGTPAKWSELARAHSIDTATNLRRGDLGFVREDGSTDVPRVRVDPALYAAAKAVKDGEIVARPVPELGRFALIWRRGSLEKRSANLAEEAGSIRSLLERQRVNEARKALLEKLRRESLKAEHPELLERLPEESLDEARPSKARPERTQRPAENPAKPRPSERGLR